MKISVIGTGAVGGLYGSLLVGSGNEVHFLLRSDYEHCKTNGLLLLSPLGDRKIFPMEMEDEKFRAYFHKDPLELPNDSDFVIVAIKSTENENLPFLLQSFKGRNSTILLIQNGIGQENKIHLHLPNAHRVFGGLAFLCCVKVSPGVIHHIDYGDLTIAESVPVGQNIEIDDEIEKLGKAFRDAKVSVAIESDLTLSRWRKLVWNIPFNGLSVILDASTNEIVEHPSTLSLVNNLMKEVQLIAKREGKEITNSFIDETINRTIKMKPYNTSMKLDFDNKRPMELGAIYLEPLHRAEVNGVQAPLIRMLYQQLSFLEK